MVLSSLSNNSLSFKKTPDILKRRTNVDTDNKLSESIKIERGTEKLSKIIIHYL